MRVAMFSLLPCLWTTLSLHFFSLPLSCLAFLFSPLVTAGERWSSAAPVASGSDQFIFTVALSPHTRNTSAARSFAPTAFCCSQPCLPRPFADLWAPQSSLPASFAGEINSPHSRMHSRLCLRLSLALPITAHLFVFLPALPFAVDPEKAAIHAAIVAAQSASTRFPCVPKPRIRVRPAPPAHAHPPSSLRAIMKVVSRVVAATMQQILRSARLMRGAP